ncbi:MAG: hypothetical protein ACR2IK_10985 [Chloroflexota bacterium]
MVTTQTAVTVMADILPGHVVPLRQLLVTAGQDAANNSLLPFGKIPNVHFARFFIIDAAFDLQGHPLSPRLILDADVDGQGSAFLAALCSVASAGLDSVYAHCTGYPGRASVLDFLRDHSIPVAAHYVNTIGRTVEQIQHDAALRQAIQSFLDRTPSEWRGADPRRVRAAIQEFVEREATLAWARRPVPAPEPAYILGEAVHAVLVGTAGIVLFPVILLGLPIWAFLLRRHEKADVARDITPDDAHVQALAAQEDHGIQNPFTSAGLLKPGPFRRFTGTLVLWGTGVLTRHVFNRASLIGVKTIHFARWTFIDQKRRVIFTSNYDGSLENYMDDFVDKIAWGLNASFSSGLDYPKTRWLILDGAHDEQVFKRFNLNHQLVAPFWYAAYKGLTALNIDNNAKIRAGLYGAMDDGATRAWLRRL